MLIKCTCHLQHHEPPEAGQRDEEEQTDGQTDRELFPYTPYWILYTDYVCSAVVYSCTDVLRIFHVDFAWILGRSRRLSDSSVQHAKQIFMENHIDISRMIESSQEDCYRDK
ncbi:Apolipoprotein D [Bagarius yarrelli]|uniref:Apolipoprotein D n=1 Tax=Bagarius yarrelli TaxID=175774 RepID=A0A556TZQ7_BAGYA|nr:Apolipoprotein D [Bagarius yarrelli]